VLLHYLAKRGNTKIAFFDSNAVLLPEFSQLLFDFFNLFDSQLIFTLLYDPVNLVINAFSLGLLGDSVQEKGSQEQLDCVACAMHLCSVFWVSSFAG